MIEGERPLTRTCSDYQEWSDMCGQIKKSYPLAQKYLEKVQVNPRSLSRVSSNSDPSSREIFEESDTDKDDTLSLNEVAAAFQKLQSKITSYPAVSPPRPHIYW